MSKHTTHSTHTHAKHEKAHVRPCERAPGKFEAVRVDGTVDPYAYRTQEDAERALGLTKDTAEPTEVEVNAE